MTAAETVPRWDHPVRLADSPFDPDRLRWVLGKVQRWAPYASPRRSVNPFLYL